MTTISKEPVTTTPAPETLTEEHHEALRASWELPAYERDLPPTTAPRARTSLLLWVLAGTVGLAVGFGAGYWTAAQTVETPEPIVITRQVPGPVDANGMTLGRRIAPAETALPMGLTIGGPVAADGSNLGRRVAAFDTTAPTPLTSGTVDAGTLGRRVAPVER